MSPTSYYCSTPRYLPGVTLYDELHLFTSLFPFCECKVTANFWTVQMFSCIFVLKYANDVLPLPSRSEICTITLDGCKILLQTKNFLLISHKNSECVQCVFCSSIVSRIANEGGSRYLQTYNNRRLWYLRHATAL